MEYGEMMGILARDLESVRDELNSARDNCQRIMSKLDGNYQINNNNTNLYREVEEIKNNLNTLLNYLDGEHAHIIQDTWNGAS